MSKKKKKNNLNNQENLIFSQKEIVREYYDDKTNVLYKFPANMLMTRINRDSKKIQKSFDKLDINRIKFLDKFYSETLSYIIIGQKKSIKDSNEKLNNFCSLLLNAANTISASFELLRSGYIMQSPALLRSIVETFSVLSAIFNDDDSYDKFLNDKLDVNSTIKVGKKFIPQIGKFQGLLSNSYVHLNSAYLQVFTFLNFKGYEDIVSITLDIIANSIMILCLISELILSSYYKNDEILFWKFDDKNCPEFNISEKGEEILHEYQKYFNADSVVINN
ncbi:DUF5677 domain-containing protein [uncultured Clostridium sp.]|uniref:DUF5677 domain-containing protein n=1 Tax=uncultured Clostridium sp. TaxID=59620 RepID=UPI0025EEB4A4|nr:DUF5677 domain-containing protein [uncultured Clostridium sp.]